MRELLNAAACAVCFGDPNSPLTKAVPPAVFFLLGVTMAILGTIAWTGFSWRRRSARLEKDCSN